MEPGYDTPRINSEQSPALPPVSPDFLPNANPEQSTERAPSAEREPIPQQQAALPPASAIAAPVLPQPVAADDAQSSATPLVSAPDAAADDDLIEKEWVDKAKHIIAETTDDPHRREQAVSQLQREYLRKRYGKEIGASE